MCLNCHVVSLEIEFNSLEAIKRMCERLGWEFKQNQTTYAWYGRWMDDSPVPRHLFETQDEYQRVLAMTRLERQAHMKTLLGKCDHAILVPGAAYEIGLIQRGSKIVPIWDWYCQGGLQTILGNKGQKLTQAYTIERTKMEAAQRGELCIENQLQDGSVQLRIQVNQ